MATTPAGGCATCSSSTSWLSSKRDSSVSSCSAWSCSRLDSSQNSWGSQRFALKFLKLVRELNPRAEMSFTLNSRRLIESKQSSLQRDHTKHLSRHTQVSRADKIWEDIKMEALELSQSEPCLASFLYASVLAHPMLERSLAFHLANKLADTTLLSTQLFSLFSETFMADSTIQDAIRADIRAFRQRDPACTSYVHRMLNFKGFLACQAYRVAHRLWSQGRNALALALQNRMSEVFQIDIHPGAKIGKGIHLIMLRAWLSEKQLPLAVMFQFCTTLHSGARAILVEIVTQKSAMECLSELRRHCLALSESVMEQRLGPALWF